MSSPHEEPIRKKAVAGQQEEEATPRILYSNPNHTMRYVEVAATYDHDLSWHEAIKRLEAAFDGKRITLYQLHSEEGPIKLSLTEEAMHTLIIAYLDYLTEQGMTVDIPDQHPLFQAFARYQYACSQAYLEKRWLEPPTSTIHLADGHTAQANVNGRTLDGTRGFVFTGGREIAVKHIPDTQDEWQEIAGDEEGTPHA